MNDKLDSVELVTRSGNSTQFYLFNLFADYVVPGGGCIWTTDLLYLLDLLGVGERAARATLARMKHRGWFHTYRQGRQSQYVISDEGRALLEEGDRRIFEEPLIDWDGKWRLVVYSLPETLRSERNELRTKLIWLGFGHLAPGTWISPHDRRSEIEALAHSLAIRDCVTLFNGRVAQPDEEIVRRCWDVPALAEEYAAFLKRYQAQYEALQASIGQGGRETSQHEELFRRRFWLTFDFQSFPRKDPNLPQCLLPPGWVGYRARDMFHDYRALLSTAMGDFLDKHIGPCIQ